MSMSQANEDPKHLPERDNAQPRPPAPGEVPAKEAPGQPPLPDRNEPGRPVAPNEPDKAPPPKA